MYDTKVSEIEFNEESILSLVPEKEGFVFSGWYIERNNTNIFCTDNYTLSGEDGKELVIKAKFAQNPITITFEPRWSTSAVALTYYSITVEKGFDFVLPTGYDTNDSDDDVIEYTFSHFTYIVNKITYIENVSSSQVLWDWIEENNYQEDTIQLLAVWEDDWT